MNQIVNMEPQALPAVQQETSILNIIASAVGSNIDTEKLERLIALQERVMKSEAEKAFNAAFAKMQAELPKIEHDKAIDHGKDGVSKKIATYARYETIVEAVRPVLQKYGFAVSFGVAQQGDAVTVTCTLTHEGGHSIQTSLALPVDTGPGRSAVQAIGSTVSYGKRYTLCAILNIATYGEDKSVDLIADQPVSKTQAIMLSKILDQLPAAAQEHFAKNHGDTVNVRKSQFQELYGRLSTALEKQKNGAGHENA